MNNCEIVFKCRCLNNKNIRANELNILRVNKMCIEFGENESYIKKRIYDDVNILNEDFESILEIKDNLSKISLEAKDDELKNNIVLNDNIDKKNIVIDKTKNNSISRRKNRK